MWPFTVCRRRRILLSTVVITGLLLLTLSITIIEENSIDFLANLLDNEIDGQYSDDDIIDDSEDDYDYEYDNPNPDFKLEDFDIRVNISLEDFSAGELRKLQSQLTAKKSNEISNQIPSPSDLSDTLLPVTKNDIFWSSQLENFLPPGVTNQDLHVITKKIRNSRVIDVQPPSWNRCGRPKNQFVTLSDGSHFCARYRYPHDYLIQGEVLSFYVGRLLGIYNIPVVVLSKVNSTSEQWGNEKIWLNLTTAGWEKNKTVALIQWIDGLDRDWMPKFVLKALKSGGNISVLSSELMKMSKSELVQLVQWSDLVVFDYITGNYDRVASMQDANEKEGKPEVMMDTVHNLVKNKNGGLWLIDNESGLIDSYFLMYSHMPSLQGSRFLSYHKAMLSTFCLFRQSTYEKIRLLHSHENPAQKLHNLVLNSEPEFRNLPDFLTPEFSSRFRQRISQVYHHMAKCANDLNN